MGRVCRLHTTHPVKKLNWVFLALIPHDLTLYTDYAYEQLFGSAPCKMFEDFNLLIICKNLVTPKCTIAWGGDTLSKTNWSTPGLDPPWADTLYRLCLWTAALFNPLEMFPYPTLLIICKSLVTPRCTIARGGGTFRSSLGALTLKVVQGCTALKTPLSGFLALETHHFKPFCSSRDPTSFCVCVWK